jgi:hypothetical protein
VLTGKILLMMMLIMGIHVAALDAIVLGMNMTLTIDFLGRVTFASLALLT